MTTEDKLKNYIVEVYGSVNEFCNQSGISSSTIFTVLKRGVNNASIQTILKICKMLNIDPNALFVGEIVPKQEPVESQFSIDDLMLWIQNDRILIEKEKLSDQEKRLLIYSLKILKMQHKDEEV